MINLQFGNDDIENIKHFRYSHPDFRVQRRMEALFLKSLGYSHGLICEVAEISEATLAKILRSFQRKGLADLLHTNYRGQPSLLHEHEGEIREMFADSPPASAKEARNEIAKLTGIWRSVPQIRKFMLSLGMKRRKTKAVPAQAKPEDQEEFLKKNLSQPYRRQKRARGWCFS